VRTQDPDGAFSGWSALQSFQTPTPALAAPTGLDIARNLDTATVRWQAAAAKISLELLPAGRREPAAIMEWLIRVWLDGKDALGPLSVPPGTTEVTVSGLDPGLDYTFTVSAVDADGVESAPVSAASAGVEVTLSEVAPDPDADEPELTLSFAPEPVPEPVPPAEEPAPDPGGEPPPAPAPGSLPETVAAPEGATSGGGGGPCWVGTAAGSGYRGLWLGGAVFLLLCGARVWRRAGSGGRQPQHQPQIQFQLQRK
jgi:hypothetical protein